MNLSAWMHVAWDFEPSVIAGAAVLLGLYVRAGAALKREVPRSEFWLRAAAFLLGDTIMLFALISPLDTLGDRYLFSAHMIQHLLLIEFAAPLLLLGLPAPWFRKLLRRWWAAALERRLRRPIVAWTIGFAVLALWHLPGPYDATVRIEALHIVEHLSFLVSAVSFWWPVLTPLQSSRRPALDSVFYLFSRMAANLVLGSLVAAAPLGFYTAYLHAPPAPLPLHLTHLADQRLGGYLMWIPTLVVDMAALPLFLALWLSRGEEPRSPRYRAETDRGAPAAAPSNSGSS